MLYLYVSIPFAIFFLFWNSALGLLLGLGVVLFTLGQGDCPSLCSDCEGICLAIACPLHMIIGAIAPIIFVSVFRQLSLIEKIMVIFVSQVVPYGYWLCYICDCPTRCRVMMAYRISNQEGDEDADEDEDDEENQGGGNGRGRPQDTGHLEDTTRIIWKKVVEGDGGVQNANTNMSFRSKHPKSDIVVNKRKTSIEKVDNCIQRLEDRPLQGNVYTELQNFDEESLFPIPLIREEDKNEEDFASAVSEHELDYLSAVSEHHEEFPINEKEQSTLNECDESVSASIQICNICLEEYKVGEDIGWSRNDECHHAFHKDCIMEWLANHDDCPICRKKY